ncbi:uncharacterized protein EI90DRAFT_3049900 [Cantharellus anzutake]|uniref:uncharacterized protein n=1 Tax=Cantharellus anzutake TaxID=1750568 RepID=UPI0019037CE7|nr:uncharacterized protein EI90DRAFT_3049900 [Cantharellus anzutake]KAF8334709.1 hypothetical protein EI90DRAFT_3049900 [Cantharellus anzutake]
MERNPVSIPPGVNPRDLERPKGKLSFIAYLEEHSDIMGKECPTPEHHQPADPLRQNIIHACINLRDKDVLGYAEAFYHQQRLQGDSAFSIKAADVLRWLIFGVMTIFIPLDIFVLLRWTLPRILNRISRNPQERESLFPPYEWSLKASLWIIFVRHAKSTTHRLSTQHSHISDIKLGKELVEARTKRLEILEALYQDWREEEAEALTRLRKLKTAASPEHRAKIDEWRREAASTWGCIVSECKNLREQIKTLKTEIEEIREIAGTQTNAQITGYRGVADWAKDTLGAHSGIIKAVSVVSVLGAGASYTSILSATRGDISYMICSFEMFMICLIIAAAAQGILTLCSRRVNDSIPNLRFWGFFVVVVVYGAGIFMVAGICFLVATVLYLDSDPGNPPVITFSPMSSLYTTFAVWSSAQSQYQCATDASLALRLPLYNQHSLLGCLFFCASS